MGLQIIKNNQLIQKSIFADVLIEKVLHKHETIAGSLIILLLFSQHQSCVWDLPDVVEPRARMVITSGEEAISELWNQNFAIFESVAKCLLFKLTRYIPVDRDIPVENLAFSKYKHNFRHNQVKKKKHISFN